MYEVNQESGYRHPAYAQSFVEFGTPVELKCSGGWILRREIPGFSYWDAMGCYPIFCCRDWTRLSDDFKTIREDLVCLSIVTDPFGDYDVPLLQDQFVDVIIPFKDHYIVDLSHPIQDFISTHHKRYARKALDNIRIEVFNQPIHLLDEWITLYANLKKRHNLRGITRFSSLAFLIQLNIPGMVGFRASFQGTTVGMLLWFVQRDIGYYHLGAFSERGYELRASFGLFHFAIDYFAGIDLKYLNLGAGAGIKKKSEDGLSRFKRGWSNGTRTAYFCGRVFDQHKYREIIQEKGVSEHDYFPVYRRGEFN